MSNRVPVGWSIERDKKAKRWFIVDPSGHWHEGGKTRAETLEMIEALKNL